MMRTDQVYRIISNKEICAGYFEIKVAASAQIVKACKPGQFFMISVPDAFLRRPISIHDAKNGVISFLYKVVGKGTKILSEIKSGELSMLGPLGNGYDMPKSINPVIIAGGTGIASVYFLAASLKHKGVLYYGAKTTTDLLCMDKFKKLGWKVMVSTEDGSQGHKGLITECILNSSFLIPNSSLLYVCGPMPMMKAVMKIAEKNNMSGYASLEEKMACGIGNCQGCAVKINGENKMTCKDGPVFNIKDITL